MFPISIVVPIFNEEKILNFFFEELKAELINSFEFEIIFVDDGSDDNSYKLLNEIKIKHQNEIMGGINVIHLDKNYGQSYGIFMGIKKSKFNNIVTIDADMQNVPKDIKKLASFYFNSEKNYKLVGGIRKNRKDNLIKKYTSFLANFIRQLILKDNCKDTGCSLKIFDKAIFLNFPYFNGIHRFIPALFKGFDYETLFVDVEHRPRVFGKSKYGTWGRLFRGIRDLFKVIRILYSNKLND